MTRAVHTDVLDGVAMVRLDVPERSMNVLTEAVLAELTDTLENAARRADVRAIVLLGGKVGGFCAGADVHGIAAVTDVAEGTRLSRLGQQAFERIENLAMPVVAAIHGVCLGGGLELALACHGMMAADDPKTRLGLPEVQIGIVPGFGGTQRLPRRIGIVAALDLILTGRTLKAKQALSRGLVDDVVCPFRLAEAARSYALELAAGKPRRGAAQRKRSRPWIGRIGCLRRLVLEKARRSVMTRTRGVYPAPLRAIELVGRAYSDPRVDGFQQEAAAVGELLAGPVSHHLVNLFLTMEDLKKQAGTAVGLTVTDRVGVVGAGVMGADIANLLLRKGARVRLFDVDAEGLRRGVERIARDLDADVRRGRLPRHEAARMLDRLEPSTQVDGLRPAAFAIEVVVERLDIKRQVFMTLQGGMPTVAPIYTNTSSIPVAAIGSTLDDPTRVLGLHFFNPVAKMPLLEVVVPPGASAAAVAQAIAVGRDLGKVPVVVRDSPGFLVNRVLAPYLAEALQLLEEGVDPATIDGMMLDLGFPMGPLRVVDTVGLDVANHVAESLTGFLGERMAHPTVGRALLTAGHLGDKSGGGIYVGRGNSHKAAPYLAAALAGARRAGGGPAPARADVADRLYLLLLAEAARAHLDGIVANPAHLDAAMILGAGFPANTGGPLREIDRMGGSTLARRLTELRARYGDRFLPGDALMHRLQSARRFHEQDLAASPVSRS